MIKGFIITIADDAGLNAANACFDSILSTESTIEPEIFPATTPETLVFHDPVTEYIKNFDAKTFEPKWPEWNWPLNPKENHRDFKTGVFKFAYDAKDQRKVKACTVSHARLWEKCVELDEPILILESDALFTRKFTFSDVQDRAWGVLGLNDPRGATRKAQVFYEKAVAHTKPGVYNVPKVDDAPVPQGLAGNSAYLIQPYAAKQLLLGMNDYGLWPNDAYICQELWPWIKITQPFYTKVQGLPSSTKG